MVFNEDVDNVILATVEYLSADDPGDAKKYEKMKQAEARERYQADMNKTKEEKNKLKAKWAEEDAQKQYVKDLEKFTRGLRSMMEQRDSEDEALQDESELERQQRHDAWRRDVEDMMRRKPRRPQGQIQDKLKEEEELAELEREDREDRYRRRRESDGEDETDSNEESDSADESDGDDSRRWT